LHSFNVVYLPKTGLVLINVRSLSGLSRRDEGVLWQEVLPGQFR
jgi:hypothetical protein